MNNFERLLGAGIGVEDAAQIAHQAAFAFDRNRKPFGSRSGALGMMGLEVYDELAETPAAFTAYQPFSAEALADKIKRSKGAVGAAINRLIEHGFIDRQREGRGFRVQLRVPAVALIEHAERCIGQSIPARFSMNIDRPLAEKVLKLFPQSSEG